MQIVPFLLALVANAIVMAGGLGALILLGGGAFGTFDAYPIRNTLVFVGVPAVLLWASLSWGGLPAVCGWLLATALVALFARKLMRSRRRK